MSSVKDGEPDHILALLGYLMDAVRRDLSALVTSPAGQKLPSVVRGLRSSQLRLLSLTPAEGMRVTDLAERVGMTKQALGEFADQLEAKGLMESLRDPHDRRVRLLRPTAAGRNAAEEGTRVIDTIEAQW